MTSFVTAGVAQIDTDLQPVYPFCAISVWTGGVGVGTVVEQGYQPAVYGALWTRDHAYILWHNPAKMTAAQRRQFVTYTLSRVTTGAETDPDGGTLPANWLPDRVYADGTAVYKNAGSSKLPYMDGIHFVVLALWADWNATGDTTTFTGSKAAIDACLATLPRSGNGCVYSDPANPSVDYGFTDGIKKTGNVAYGTALQAWAYKMLSEITGENGVGPYSTLRAATEVGLATLRKINGFYMGSSINNASVDDVWATALIVAEGLVPGADRIASATALANAYKAGSITQGGWVRHLPVGQFWTGGVETPGQYQNGGYWLTPLWDCVRSVDLVDADLARAWAAEAMATVYRQFALVGSDAPYEWVNGGLVGAVGYVTSAAVVARFVGPIPLASTFPAGWLAGTGKVGAPTGDGNRDVYLSADGVTPTWAGSVYLDKRAQFAVKPPSTGLDF